MIRKLTFLSTLVFVLFLQGCGITSHRSYEGVHKPLNEIAIVADAQYQYPDKAKLYYRLLFVSLNSYDAEGKVITRGRLGTPGLGYPSKYIEVSAGKHLIIVNCSDSHGASAGFPYSLTLSANTTTVLACEPVPENNFRARLRVVETTQTNPEFKRLDVK